MDATATVRIYLRDKGFHDYSTQKQGQIDKVLMSAEIMNEFSTISSTASLYRPTTKKGDPRIWFTGLKQVANANDILGIIGFNSKLYIINLTQLPLEKLVNSPIVNPLQDLVVAISKEENAIANELLLKLKQICSNGFIKSSVRADTAVGRTLEMALGISINSSKEPDYKGIELKSYREKRGNRKTLFAQVPDWKISDFKSSREILERFGYFNVDGEFKLYCTVSARSRNPQSLMLRVDKDSDLLFENSDKKNIGDFITWTLDKLHKRLLEKHNETFWIAAESKTIGGLEHFRYHTVEHTQKPIVSQFDILLEQGIITLDHSIKMRPNGQVTEKGPFFKISPNSLGLLFPPSKTYSLV